jgi:hypothetical protein
VPNSGGEEREIGGERRKGKREKERERERM